MAKSSAAEQADARKERAEARARKQEPESDDFPRALKVDSETIKRRDELAAELLSHYEFLAKMYLPDDCIKRPPKGGWPSITAERLAFLGKTDAAIDLLKHIPYISQDAEQAYQIEEKCICNDYTGKRFEEAVKFQDRDIVDPLPEYMEEDVWDRFKEPQHIVTLARSAVSDAGYHTFFDTRDGQLASIEFIDGNCLTYDNPKKAFEATRDSFRELAMFPIGPTDVKMTSRKPFSEEQRVSVLKVFEKYGWPTADYQKKPCMAEVFELRQSFFNK